MFAVTAVFCFGCKKTETPAFLHIEQVDLRVSSVEAQGTNDHAISDAWVYLNDDLVGIYEVPATVPIISEGPQKISIIAGIENNGISSSRINYPFFDTYISHLNLIRGDTIDFSDDAENASILNGYYCPVVEYFDGLEFWNERFEEGNLFESTEDSDTEISITYNPALVFNYDPDHDSQGSGLVELTADEPYFEIRSTHEFAPQKGQRVYLEINYFTECPLQVGVYEMEPTLTKVYGKGLYPVSNWSKIYIELTSEVAQRANAESYSIFIEGILDAGQSECTILLDNVKLIFPE